MPHLLLTVRFLDDRYHGLLDRGGPPEWPPSPFRLFQALVAGVARRGELVDGKDVPSNTNYKPIGQALDWLQRRTREHPPIIIAPKSKTGQAITRFVPNNDGDKKFDRQERLAAKPTIPTLFILKEGQKPEVHYIWDVAGTNDCPIADIERAARSLTTLGWGVDMAFADARLVDESELEALNGIRWHPKERSWPFQDTLRVPTYDDDSREGTLCDLRQCHDTFIRRIEHGKPLKTVDKPKVFDRVLYTSSVRPIGLPCAVFRLFDDEEEPYRHPHARLNHVAAMVRHAAIECMKGDPPSWKKSEPTWLETFVCGHRGDSAEHHQLSYVPLPSIGHEHSDAKIRNVMIVAPFGCERELEHIAERLDGGKLTAENVVPSPGLDKAAIANGPIYLERIRKPPRDKFIAQRYLGSSRIWQSVTPAILPGHDDKKATKTEKLIQKALEQSGIEMPCRFTWQSVPFLKNCLSAHKYDRNGRHTGYHRPAHLRDLTAVHLTLRFGHRENPNDENSRWISAEFPIPGPIAIGAGRHCGFGLMAAVDDWG